MPEKNFELMDQTLGVIESNLGRWDQLHWGVRRALPERRQREKELKRHVCETAFCFAGHTALIARPDLPWVERDKWRHVIAVHDSVTDPKTGYSTSMKAVAMEALGLYYDEAELLFDGENSLPKIKRIIAGWKKEAATKAHRRAALGR
jgi:hypothetical protein